MPKISIALFGRNDNYIENYLDKVKLSIRSIQRSLDGIDYEIVFLDYNPPSDRPLLSECFPISEYSRVKHVVLSREDHLEFINRHLDAGSRVLLNGRELPSETIYGMHFMPVFAGILSIKNCSGDYILSTGSDNIFPIQFGKFIKKLQPDTMYRTWTYRTYKEISINELSRMSYSDYDSFADHKRMKAKDVRKFKISEDRFLFPKKSCRYLWESAGNFMLMDRKSWKEVNPFISTINHRLPKCDNQGVFHSLTYGKKIKCANFPIFNIHNFKAAKYGGYDCDSNFIIKNDTIIYDQLEEIEKWGRYEKWARRSLLKPNREYFLKTGYRNRFDEVKKIFKSILPDKFLI